MDKETEEKIVALETKLAYLEDYVNQLQQVSVENSEIIERLREENRIISSRFREVMNTLEEIPNRKPPHY